MPFYYFEKKDPNDPTGIIRYYFADDDNDTDDVIYGMPSGIENYDKLKEIVGLAKVVMKDVFLQNKSISTNSGYSLVPNLKKSKYQDPELAKIDMSNSPIDIRLVPDDPKTFTKGVQHIKVEGPYVPENVRINKLIDFETLPKFTELSEENFQHYTKVEEEMPSLDKIRRGMKVKILGDHLKIRPTDNGDHGFFLEDEEGKQLELTDFLEVNSNTVLLLSVPKDLPTGSYRIVIKSGWYADSEVTRQGRSKSFLMI